MHSYLLYAAAINLRLLLANAQGTASCSQIRSSDFPQATDIASLINRSGIKCLLSASSSDQFATLRVVPRLWVQDQCLFELPRHWLVPECLVKYCSIMCLECELLWGLVLYAAPNVRFIQYSLSPESHTVRTWIGSSIYYSASSV